VRQRAGVHVSSDPTAQVKKIEKTIAEEVRVQVVRWQALGFATGPVSPRRRGFGTTDAPSSTAESVQDAVAGEVAIFNMEYRADRSRRARSTPI